MPIGSGLLTGLVDLGSQIFGNRGERRAQERTIKANKEMAEYQYSKDLEMWNRQNQYNTPEAQMQRLEGAGLNKNMVYGQGSVAGNTSGQMPKYQAPTVEYQAPKLDLGSTMGIYYDLEQQRAQTKQIEANTKNTEQRTLNELIKNSILTGNVRDQNQKWGQREQLFTHNLEFAKGKITAQQQEIRNKIASERESNQRTSNLYTQGQNLLKEGRYLEYKAKMADKGININDPVIYRQLLHYLDDLGINIDTWIGSLGKKISPRNN